MIFLKLLLEYFKIYFLISLYRRFLFLLFTQLQYFILQNICFIKIDIDQWLERAKRRDRFTEQELKFLISKVEEIIILEPNVISLQAPINVCGDIHGQFYDLMNLFSIGGEPAANNRYLFLGDYVDRGNFSIQVVTLLYLYKLKYPTYITILHGNHESRSISQSYGLYDQVINDYGSSALWKALVESFDFLPLSAVIETQTPGNTLFCVHGGISPNVQYIRKVQQIVRSVEIPADGIYSDLLWSDPDPRYPMYQQSSRGAGYVYGEKAVKEFHHLNNTSIIARAHQVAMKGYQYWFNEQVVTVWSAPNYFYKMKNDASIMNVSSNGQRSFKIFQSVPEPDF